MEETKKPCPEIPFFGAKYPDATCIDGYLWDLDSSDVDSEGNDVLTSGGDEPCPFCRTEEFLEKFADEEGVPREKWIKEIERLRDRYGR